MFALEVENLVKHYEKFSLKHVSFKLKKGYIMGFIGSNGAGKTTTIKSILNMIKTDSGEITVLGKNFIEHEIELKQEVGYAFGGVNYYEKRKVKQVTSVVKRFYKNWNEDLYHTYMKKFKLDEEKKIFELSRGMRVKYELALALSHEAKLFILDEPTSGLDPVARDQLLELFQGLVEDGEKSILFSTHITSDLEKCADYITFISNGKIVGSDTYESFIDTYRLVKGTKDAPYEGKVVARKDSRFGYTALVRKEDVIRGEAFNVEKPSLDDIMIYFAKEEEDNESVAI